MPFCLMSKLFTLGNIIFNSDFKNFRKFYLVHSWVLCPKYILLSQTEPVKLPDHCNSFCTFFVNVLNVKKRLLRNFTKFTGKHLCQKLFVNKIAGLRPATLLKKRLWHRCFPVNFVKFLRRPFYIEHLWWLLPYFWNVVAVRALSSRVT